MSPRQSAVSPDDENRRTTFDVRVWSVKKIALKKGGFSWQTRWQVAGRPRANTRTFASKAAAASRHAEILTAVRKGQAFDVETGLPLSEWLAIPRSVSAPAPGPAPGRTWLAVARDYVDAKWAEHQAPGTRRTIATVLGAVTPALFDERPPNALTDLVHEALVGWVFLTGERSTLAPGGRRVENEPPDTWAAVLTWMEAHSRPIADLADPDVARAALVALSHRRDGKQAAANTISSRRMYFGQVLNFAVARGDLASNPLQGAQWTPPRRVVVVDRRAVVDHRRALRLLAAVADERPDLEAFFACIYYAATRPGETNELNINQLQLPETGWGEAALEGNNPEVSPRWSDEPDKPRQARQLKHREQGEVRPVPLHPDLVALLRRHIEEFGIAPDGRIFRSTTGGPIRMSTYLTVWRRARERALTPAEAASPLARRPYDLRHAAVSRWLNAGVPPTQVAEWAGHSVRVLLTVYAKCIVGEEQRALRLIDASFATEQEPDESPATPAPTQSVSAAEIHGKSTDTRMRPDAAGQNRIPSVTDPSPAADLADDSWGL
ncbi:tyrosine-type recombinase/integrase [Frankia sp. AgB1.9]|uniref:tyrosine-type recombinase/integrase n=1 Tax=unclassified Frankia TaxID=2632575 RepID=UPI001931B587|nr:MULTISPECIES: tyrosine-type recombinase/integrase [unclassified Frankia]MBL7487906.1 tyrosine-type recombinase/integrase [Frankia sp. AgW1.1]MBL7549972.1 tyrosine-type recombinase/integrase [Frankia sp. AgB1.9]MBL7621450.1 tyrosine-type recombinase/integrase [Frankia sp. AgB1.8]